MVIATNKGLGAALIKRATYTKKSWSKHLSDHNVYKEIPPHQIHTIKVHMKYKLGELFSKCQKFLPEHELTYLEGSGIKMKMATASLVSFTCCLKCIKPRGKLCRPVVARCDTIWYGISRWADHYLKRFIPFIPSYKKDCFQVKRELKKLYIPSHEGLSQLQWTSLLCTQIYVRTMTSKFWNKL